MLNDPRDREGLDPDAPELPLWLWIAGAAIVAMLVAQVIRGVW